MPDFEPPQPPPSSPKITKEEFLQRRRQHQQEEQPLKPTRTLTPPTPGAFAVEYRVGWGGRLADAVRATTLSFLLGCLLAFAFVLVLGLAAEEDVFEYDINQGIDAWSRAAVGLISVLAVAGAFVATFTRGVVDRATASALVRAARAGAPKLEAPATAQRERVAARSFRAFLFTLGWFLGLTLLIMVGFVSIAIDENEGDEGFWLALTGVAAVAALLIVGAILLITKVIRRSHDRDRNVVTSHWSRVAWSSDLRSAAEEREYGIEKSDRGRAGLPRAGAVATRLGTVALILAAGFIMLILIFRKPGGRFSNAPTQYYSDEVEGFLSIVIVAAVVAAAVGGAALLIGLLMTRIARQRDMSVLGAAMEDEDAPRPSARLLQRATRPASAEWALLLTAVGGALLLIAAPAYAFAEQGVIPFDGAQPELLVTVVASAVAFLAGLVLEIRAQESGRLLRNRIEERWPGSLD